jgi:hypothetical protein
LQVNGILGVLEIWHDHRCVPTIDMLHVAKNFPAKMLNHPICLNRSIAEWKVSGERLAEIPELRDVLEDRSSIGKRRDSYAILLFAFRNAEQCLAVYRPMDCILLLIIVFPLAALRQENIDIENRRFYAHSGLVILTR